MSFLKKFPQAPATLQASYITVAVVLVLVFAKAVAVIFSGSAAVLAALIDSLSDVALSLMTLISLRVSMKPADEDHRYGHGKVEGITALLQAACLAGGGVFLIMESITRLMKPNLITDHMFTMFLMGVAVVLSGGLSWVQRRAAQKSDSLALEADSLHYSSDVWINLSVFMVVFLDYLGSMPVWFDPVCAIIVAGLMCRAAWNITMKSMSMLMDQQLPDDIKSRIIAIIRSHQSVLGFHDLRATQTGMRKFIAFDIEVDPSMLLWSAHEISRDLEQAIIREFPESEVMIHIDPFGDIKDSRHDDLAG